MLTLYLQSTYLWLHILQLLKMYSSLLRLRTESDPNTTAITSSLAHSMTMTAATVTDTPAVTLAGVHMTTITEPFASTARDAHPATVTELRVVPIADQSTGTDFVHVAVKEAAAVPVTSVMLSESKDACAERGVLASIADSNVSMFMYATHGDDPHW